MYDYKRMIPDIPTYVNVILAAIVVLLSMWIFYRPRMDKIIPETCRLPATLCSTLSSQQSSKRAIETFTGYNDNVAENMDNTYSTQTACGEENPDGALPIYLRWKKNRCTNGYVDLNRDMLKVPLYMYPALKYHPVYDPFGELSPYEESS